MESFPVAMSSSIVKWSNQRMDTVMEHWFGENEHGVCVRKLPGLRQTVKSALTVQRFKSIGKP